jgi:hypothetical protein
MMGGIAYSVLRIGWFLMGNWQGFDPEFDDTAWTDGWLDVAIAQVPPGRHPSGYRVERRVLQSIEVFGQPMRLAGMLECRLLFDPEGKLWMSDTPQERIMMFNNGRRSRGHVLVGGLGLGLYPQFAVLGAAGKVTRFTIIEHSPVVREIVEPTLAVTLGVPMEIMTGDAVAFLSEPVTVRYDTIFLDTWETLDAVHLPKINRLRDLALRHLAPGGRVLLWGYRWIVRLFEDACLQLLKIQPGQRQAWLMAQAGRSPQAVVLLTPVLERFGENPVDDVETALTWCREYIVRRMAPI